MTTETDDHNEFGLKSLSELESESEADYQMEDISMAEIINEKEGTLVDGVKERFKEGYEGLRNLSGPNLKQGVTASIGGFGLQASTGFNFFDPFYWAGWVTTVTSPAFAILVPETEVGKFLPELPEDDEIDREYHLVEHSIREMVERSETAMIGDRSIEPSKAGEIYEEILKDLDSNEKNVNNNLQVMAYEPNEDNWEYRVEIYSSGFETETVRGITKEDPDKYLKDESVNYEEAEELLEK